MFIMLTDALTNKTIILRKDLIFKAEVTDKGTAIHFLDYGTPIEYVQESVGRVYTLLVD